MRNVTHQAMPAFKTGVILCAGILAGKQLPASSTSIGVLVLLLILCSLTLLILHLRRGACPQGALSLLALLICFLGGAAKIQSDRGRNVSLPDSLARQVTVVGQIQEAATVANGRIRLAVQSELLLDRGVHHVLRANILAMLIPSTRDSGTPRLEYGMKVLLRGAVEHPTAERNPGEFSPREYYEANGISLLMTIRGTRNVSVLDSNGGSWIMREMIVPIRSGMLSLIDSTVEGEEREFLKGLMIGDRSGISQATRQAFVNSGVAHVLAVSGSNVAVVAGIFIFLFQLMRLPRTLRAFAVLLGLYLYMAITGNQPSIVRATIMAFVFLLANFFQRKSNAYNAMGISALVILGIDARQLFDIGFQLSYGAVLSIIYLYPKANSWITLIPTDAWWQRALIWLLRICAVSLVATLGTLPLTAVSFGRVSVVGIAANVFVIPAVEFSVVLGFASACTGLVSQWLAGTYAAVNELILTWTLRIIRLAGNTSFAYIDTTTFAPIDSLPFYAALFLLFNHTGRSLVWGTIMLLAFLNVAVYGPRGMSSIPAGVLRVSFIDVGQGDAVLAQLPEGRVVLVDAGPMSWQFDAGEKIVLPFLKRRGVSTIDLLVISHGHNDHAGGVASVMRNFRVRRIAALGGLPSALTDLKRSAGGRTQWLDSTRVGVTILDSTDARAYVFYPMDVRPSSAGDTASDNRCIVFKLQYGDVSFLFTGDADKTAEQEMVAAYGPFLHSDLLKAGHHGSSTSTSQLFLETVKPSTVVIPVGRNNKFRHPSPSVVERIQAFCGLPVRTDEEGAVMYETDGRTLWRFNWR